MTTPRAISRGAARHQVRDFVVRTSVEGGALLVIGDPGTGKSLLLRDAAELARGLGSRVLRAEGVELESDVSHAVLNQLLVPLVDDLQGLSTLHRSALTVALGLEAGPTPDRFVVANAVLAVLRGLAHQQPVLVVVDDLPLVDRASAFVLGFVARRLGGTRVGFLASRCSGAESLLERAGIETIDLLDRARPGEPDLDDSLSTAWPAEALQAAGRRDFDAAYRLFSSISPVGAFEPDEPFALRVVLDLVEAAERSGHHAEAVAHVEAARTAGIAVISSRLALLCAGSEALVCDAASAAAAYERALDTPGADQWPFDRARIELAYGEHLRRQRHTTRARVRLQSALDVFTRLGAVPWQRRAQSELRATNQTRRSRASATPSDLTPQEREIALLGATGLTNRQIAEHLFISPRTVGAHLYRIFPKLGIGTRAGLRDALPEQPLPVAS